MPDLIARLDALLEIYLDRLDTYQKLREDLSKDLSAGFLSLAQANRTGNLGSGRRYGEEGYDERMKAGTRVAFHIRRREDKVGPAEKDVESNRQPMPYSNPEIILHTIGGHLNASMVDSEHSANIPMPSEKTASAASYSSDDLLVDFNSSTPDAINSSSSTPATQPSTFSLPPTQSENRSTKPQAVAKKPLNPLTWYGLLVPASLRAAQTSFTAAVEVRVPRLLDVQAEMVDLELQIRKLRREAGLVQEGCPQTTLAVDNPASAETPPKRTQSPRAVDPQPAAPNE